MRRCVVFMAAAFGMVNLSARADYLFVKIDLSQVYQNIPSMPSGINIPGPGAGAIRTTPSIEGAPLPKVAPGDGPFVFAVIDMKSKYLFEGKKDDKGLEYGAHVIDHAWGKKGRFIHMPNLTPSIIKYTKLNRDSAAKEYEKTFKKDLASSKDAKKFLQAATWALQHGLSKEFHAAMEEMVKLEPKSPIAANYRRVSEALMKAPTADDPGLKSLVADLTKADAKYHTVVGESGFYVGVTNLPTAFDVGIKRRIGRLHETLERFYYWFALNDQLTQPELPRSRKLLVVPSSVDEFYAKHAEWGSQPFIGDGLTPRRDNFILMSWRPIDELYRTLDAGNQELCKKLHLPKDSFITGTVWDGNAPTAGRDLFQLAFTQTLILVQKAMEEDHEMATLSREGARQLLYSTGILSRQVHTPEWIAQGLASFFETPAGAPFRGVGTPSWSNLVTFNHLRSTKKFDRPADVLMNVATDRYFRSAQKYFSELADAADKEQLYQSAQEQMDLATSTAWAFTYYMIDRRRQPQMLVRYCQELNALPRDLDLDERALEACFAKAFDLGEAGNPARIDQAKLAVLANAWFTEMSGVSLEFPELQNEYLELRKSASKRSAAN